LKQEDTKLTDIDREVLKTPTLKTFSSFQEKKRKMCSGSDVKIVLGVFKNDTLKQYLSREDKSFLSSDKRVELSSGTLVYMMNIETRELIGVAEISSWEDGSLCRERHLLDVDPYTGIGAKYNRYEIAVKKVVILRKAMKCEELRSPQFLHAQVQRAMAATHVGAISDPTIAATAVNMRKLDKAQCINGSFGPAAVS